MDSEQNYLTSALRQFKFYESLGKKTIDQLEPKGLFFEPAKDTNSIAIIVQHLHGNMLSRWTDFLTSDGEKSWRKRDEEFEVIAQKPEEVLKLWEDGWKCLYAALEPLQPEDLQKIIYIRNEGQTVLEAINRQLCHYSYHVGQIVFIGKILKQESWQSLSIPKNKSQEYNQTKFSADKERKHFTDEFLK
ncbi:MAG: DinB superfamily protein [Crocinitomicaceae bacterium]|jgi:hypothetical protein|nr:DinB superfamily protein [Crocinitomicaceae bacterium]